MNNLEILEHHLIIAENKSRQYGEDIILLRIPLDIFATKFEGSFNQVQDILKRLCSKYALDMSAIDNGGIYGHNKCEENHIEVKFIIDYEERERRLKDRYEKLAESFNTIINSTKKPNESYKKDWGISK